MRPPLIFISLVVVLCAALFYSLSSGSLETGWRDVLAALTGSGDDLRATVIIELRWPRTLAALTTGALLALAGALMQVLLRNPLADPYVLGVSGGAASGALLAMMAGLGGSALQGTAFAGAVLSMLMVFGLARGSGNWTTHRLLLTGVVVAAGWGAVIGFLLTISPQGSLRGMLFWLMGDLSYSAMPRFGMAVLAAGLLAGLATARSLNVLVQGETAAAALGVAVAPLRLAVYIIASLLTAAAVTTAGSIGFVGLVVPHMLRLLGLRSQRLLLPAAVLLGGSLLVIADTLARTLLAPQQLPVGILTALVGVPLFLLLLYRNSSGGAGAH